VRVSGILAGRPISTRFGPALSFQLGVFQLLPASGSTAPADQQQGLTPTQTGTIAAVATTPNTLGIGGASLPVGTVRWLALAGLVLSIAAVLPCARRKLRQPRDSSARIQARYRHLIVPIAGITPSPTRPPIEVTSIDALAQLAERSERLILHHHHDGADSYLIDDEGTLYRFQPRSTEQRGPQAPVTAATAEVRFFT